MDDVQAQLRAVSWAEGAAKHIRAEVRNHDGYSVVTAYLPGTPLRVEGIMSLSDPFGDLREQLVLWAIHQALAGYELPTFPVNAEKAPPPGEGRRG